MKTRLTTVTELKQIFTETFLNNTSAVSKVSDNSVLGGVAFGIAKIAQKAIKDIALVEAHTFVDMAYGSQLDTIADSKGIAPRFGASSSSTFVRVVGTPGTTYTAGLHVFSGSDGINFSTETTTVIGPNGYSYVKIRSVTSGANTNVDALVLTRVAPVPPGHQYCVNEYGSYGGRDIEQDELFKKRIKEGANLAATSTISKLTQIINKINPSVMRVFYQGTNSQSQVILGIATHNGIDLTTPEMNSIENQLVTFLAISDLQPFGNTTTNVELVNIQYQPIDITFRVQLDTGFNPDSTRVDIQTQFSKYLDFRFWKSSMKVEWDELLGIVKNTIGVKSVSDTNFIPGHDVIVDNNKLPRIRSFMMLDLDGNILSNVTGSLNPVYYPSDPDSSYQQTILASI